MAIKPKAKAKAKAKAKPVKAVRPAKKAKPAAQEKEPEKLQASDVTTEPKESGLTDDQEKGLDELSGDFVPAEPGSDGKKKERVDPKLDQSAAMINMALMGIFEVLGSRMGDHWRLDPKEAAAIAQPAAMVLDKYAPDFENGPELALLGAVGVVVLPRVIMQRQLVQQPKEPEPQPQKKEVKPDGNQPASQPAQ